MKGLIIQELSETQQKHKVTLMQTLKKFIPETSVELCVELLMVHKLHLHIEVARKSKYGDYSAHEGKGNRISINHNLSSFEFLITFIHELSHHTAFKKYPRNIDAHGAEWKEEFKANMLMFFQYDIFPDLLKQAVAKHMKNPKYSHSSDIKLMTALRSFSNKNIALVLNEIPEGSHFKMKNNPVIMIKKKKLRTYFLCETVETKKLYKVHAFAEVEVIS